MEVDLNSSLKTKGEVESALCDAVSGFYREHFGHGPKDIQASLVGRMALVHLRGGTSRYERNMGSELLKSVRERVISSARQVLLDAVRDAGLDAEYVFYDLSAATNDEVMVFSLEREPVLRVRRF